MSLTELSRPRCALEWGRRGANDAAARGDVIAICDILSFSTAVVTAAMCGARVYPCADEQEANDYASRFGAEIAVHREDVSADRRFSLSPITFLTASPDDIIALPSPNGASCCRAGADAPAVLVACMLNAAAAARALTHLSTRHRASVTIVACAERRHESAEVGSERFALEDYLGAGAVLAGLDLAFSPDAAVCRAAFLSTKGDLRRNLTECESGVELYGRGWGVDVEHAAQLDICSVVPMLIEGCLVPELF